MSDSSDPQIEQIKIDAEAGDATAQFILGGMYENADGVDLDLSKAHQWYEKSAAQGYADAQFNLGVMYETGNGVKADYAKAKSCMKKRQHKMMQRPNSIWA